MISLIITLLHTRHIYPRRPWREGRARGPCTENAVSITMLYLFASQCVRVWIDIYFFRSLLYCSSLLQPSFSRLFLFVFQLRYPPFTVESPGHSIRLLG
jgi:hypothetical protein